MAKLKIELKGFADMVEKIAAAGGDVDSATSSCMRQCANIVHAELQAAMKSTGVDDGLTNRMPQPVIEVEHNRYTAHAGYELGSYNPENLSDGYKAAFINFGTPNRTKHGKVAPRGFIEKARKSATPKVKKTQKQTLEDILGKVSK